MQWLTGQNGHLFLICMHICVKLTYIICIEVIKEVQIVARITVSFKNTTKDMQLYTLIKNMEEQSDYIKTALTFYTKWLEENKK